MKRVLTMARRSIPANEVADFFDTARNRRAYFEAAGCRYWVFEEAGGSEPTTFLEFAEAPDARTLAAAIRGAAGSFDGPIFSEVETH